MKSGRELDYIQINTRLRNVDMIDCCSNKTYIKYVLLKNRRIKI